MMIDTLKIHETLKQASFTDEQSSALAKVINESVHEDHLATKGDLNGLEGALNALEDKLTDKINGVETRLETKINGVEARLETKIDGLGDKITIRVAGVTFAIMSFFYVAERFFG